MKGSALTLAERRRIEKVFESVPFVRFLGMELVGLERGEAVVRIASRDELRRSAGVLHGGVAASLIDTAAAFVIMTVLGPEQATTTVDLTVHYLSPVRSGFATARGRIVRSGRRVIIVAVDVFDAREALLATALTTYIRVN